MREPRTNHPSAFLARQFLTRALGEAVGFLERLAVVSRAPAQRGFAPQRPVIRILEEPHSHGSARRIVQVGLSVHFQENLLRHVFRLSRVVQDVDRDVIDQPHITSKQRRQRVAIRRVHAGHQFGIRRCAGGRIRIPLGVFAHHSCLSECLTIIDVIQLRAYLP